MVGTPLERRFTQEQIRSMSLVAGLHELEVSEQASYWCAMDVLELSLCSGERIFGVVDQCAD